MCELYNYVFCSYIVWSNYTTVYKILHNLSVLLSKLDYSTVNVVTTK